MEYTIETAYEAMKSELHENKTGDPVHDWIVDNKKQQEMITYIRAQNFEQLIYDCKIWNKSKHVLKMLPLEEDEEVDEDELDADGEPINWLLYGIYQKLFQSMWYQPDTRLQMIVKEIASVKKDIIECEHDDCVKYMIHRYESLIMLLKEWIKHSEITTKQALIEYLPLDLDCNNTIHAMYKHILS